MTERRFQGKSAGVDPATARQLRTAKSAEVRRRARGAAARAKRYRALGAGAATPAPALASGPALEALQHAVQALRGAEDVGKALQQLRAVISRQLEADDRAGAVAMLDACCQLGLPELLVPLVAEQQATEAITADALWCLTNLASGSMAQAAATMVAAPAMIALLESGHRALAEQAAWALGNIAGDGQDLRDQLKKMGAMPPLVAMLRDEGGVLCGLEGKRTAAWALSNLARGAASPAQPFMELGADAALLSCVRSFAGKDGAREVVVEAAWALSFLTAKEPECCQAIIEKGGMDVLVPVLLAATARDRDVDVGVVIPVLRSISNMLPIGEDTIGATLQRYPDFVGRLASMLTPAAMETHLALCKEALWTVSNCCALRSREAAALAAGERTANELLAPEQDAVFVGLVEQVLKPVCWHLCNSTFELKREAAYALFNLVSRPSPDTLIRVLTLERGQPVLESVLWLLNAPDLDLVSLALDLVELVLAKLSNPFAAARLGGKSGSQLVQMCNGIEALEELQYAEGKPPAMAERCHALVDKYFGEDYEEEEADAAGQDQAVASLGGGNLFASTGAAAATAAASAAAPSPPAAGRGRGLVTPAWASKAGVEPGQTKLGEYFGASMQQEQ